MTRLSAAGNEPYGLTWIQVPGALLKGGLWGDPVVGDQVAVFADVVDVDQGASTTMAPAVPRSSNGAGWGTAEGQGSGRPM